MSIGNSGAGFTLVGEHRRWQGRTVSLAVAEIRAPDGSMYEREIIRHPGAAVVVPLDGRSVIMIRQYRAAANREMLEIPAGKLDAVDEPPAVAAQRELEEEIGKRAANLDLLAVFYNSPGFCDEVTHCYLATDLVDAGRSPHSIEEQHMAIESVDLDDVPGLVAAGRLMDAKSIIGLMLARERLG